MDGVRILGSRGIGGPTIDDGLDALVHTTPESASERTDILSLSWSVSETHNEIVSDAPLLLLCGDMGDEERICEKSGDSPNGVVGRTDDDGCCAFSAHLLQ